MSIVFNSKMIAIQETQEFNAKKKHKILNKVSLTLSIMQMVTSVAIFKILFNLIGILKWHLRPNIESRLLVRRRTSISILYVNS